MIHDNRDITPADSTEMVTYPQQNADSNVFQSSLEIWERQVADVSNQVKTAIGEMSSRFTNLTVDLESAIHKSHQSTEKFAIEIDGEIHQSTIVELFNQTEKNLGEVIQALSDSQRAKDMLVSEVREFSRFTKNLADMSEQVADNARMTNILSLNARIEAAKMAGQSQGFSIVASEVRELALSSASIGKNISDLVTSFNNSMSSVVALTEKNAKQDTATLSNSEKLINGVMDNFQNLTTGLVESAEEMRSTGDNIRSEISNMLVNLQFQDRVTQILENIEDHMRKLRLKISEISDSGDANTVVNDLEAWLENMESSYTTAEQRQAHQGENTDNTDQSQVTFF